MTLFDRRLPGRRVKAGLTVALSLLAAACVFAPGKFTSTLDLRQDRSFRFAYSGELIMIPLQKSAEPAFEPEDCYDDNYDERDCTPTELAEQKAQWQEQQAQKRKNDSEAAQMLLGGLDPHDPRAGEEVAAKLRRQSGWNKVAYKGDGRFDVVFEIAGKLDHDFAFPTIEGFPMSNAFVQLSLRQDGSVRIEAPSFGPSKNSGAMMGGMMAGINSDSDAASGDATALADGTFTVTTDGEILANNTDEGPTAAPDGRQLVWQVNPRTPAAPTALVKLKP